MTSYRIQLLRVWSTNQEQDILAQEVSDHVAADVLSHFFLQPWARSELINSNESEEPLQSTISSVDMRRVIRGVSYDLPARRRSTWRCNAKVLWHSSWSQWVPKRRTS